MPLAEQEVVWTVVVAGGSGSRIGVAKQYEHIGGQRMVDRSAAVAASSSTGVVVVVPAADVDRERHAFGAAAVVGGGSTRSESVRAGLQVVPDDATIVCIHDAARPFASPALYAAVVAAVHAGADGAVPGVAVTDTVKVIDESRVVVATPDRASLVAVQTPQAFRAEVLRAAHARAGEGTDDAALVEALGGRVVVVDGEADNRKVTLRDDLAWADARASAR